MWCGAGCSLLLLVGFCDGLPDGYGSGAGGVD